ncbi:DUF2309 domain-containing protein [Halorientalis sp. IM1011]|uniref:DUF2309 domain-containing protein n=1 Tax=Halorientalis sp. IM1011 TaxID=1932360 RepID=UPI00097CCF5A|nr:DUF2309 domain-containing protein [Halorientalis sp. IM1011]AQL42620.1 DUF2309 domain-containing protein [Halorientalis sp. IM1011]
MNTESAIEASVEQAADSVGSVWPLHSFVTANPLAGFEDRPFHEAVERAEDLLGGDGYPSTHVFRRAWEAGRIDPDVLTEKLDAHGYDADPEALLDRMEEDADPDPDVDTAETPADRVDAVLTKWLAAFMDQGTATWSMPDREQGFYAAVRAVARHDGDIPDGSADDTWPTEPGEAIERVLDEHPRDEWPTIFEHHLTALPGWAGYIKQRAAEGGEWQSTYPITLIEYLAVRLTLADLFDAPIRPSEPATDDKPSDSVPLEEVWLSAWEASYRSELVEAVSDASPSVDEPEADGRPAAQFVFCIDTRSEIIRRHVEATGDYETHGYAGFFGIPMRYEGYDTDVSVDACPPIVDAEHRITDRPTGDAEGDQQAYDRWSNVRDAGGKLVKSLRSNAATAFSYVESAGAGYGLALAARTLLPGRVYDAHDAADERVPADHEVCEPSVDYNPDAVTELREGLTLDEKVEYAAAAFETMGWEEFARVVVFAGHASQTANNPFDSSLDCGACAGNPGGPNARVLATICNDEDVRAELRERGIEIPEDTVFVAGEHNTTTDEAELFDDAVPESHTEDIAQLRADLETARAGAAAERAGDMGAGEDAGVREVERRAADWAETRPEWGLAGNAGFVVGPRDLTEDLDLDGRSFLHSYDWRTDDDGDALEAIVTGPLVVTQWINTQYYFATVDTGVYGSGSKVTHNPVGNVGVYQGNGGDLLTGLPLQSLKAADDEPYHQPLRLSTVIHAPVERVTEVLADHDEVTELLDNGWLSLTVVDPEQDHRAFHYDGELTWTGHEEAVATATQNPTAEASTEATADD